MEIHFSKTDFINMINGIQPFSSEFAKDALQSKSLPELKKTYIAIKEALCILYEKDCAKRINRKYGVGKTIKIVEDKCPTTIRCSDGSSGRFTKVRVINNELEIYHDWYNYGWLTFRQALKEYPNATYEIINMF